MARSIREIFSDQGEACEKLGSDFTARVCRLASARLGGGAVAGTILGWEGDASALGDSVPLRLCGALHALVLTGKSKALAAVYPPHHGGVSDDDLWAAIAGALVDEESFILHRLQGPPQTNEVRRVGATLPMFLEVMHQTGLPLVLSEVGASAGLNLFLDEFHITLGEDSFGNPASAVHIAPKWLGGAAPDVALDIHTRAGCDLLPVDPGNAADRERMLSFIWPDQADRLQRTRAAFDIAAHQPEKVEKADALDWLKTRTAEPMKGVAHVIYSTIAWQYLPEEARARGEEIIRAAGARATKDAPLAWARMEIDGKSPGTGLTLILWPSGEEHLVGRADFHGRWIDWQGWPK
ncbi:DUF2332 domain-containing protein [Sneathiella sp. HT1-7]|uniref:DUF2332 domain-containing protein n=1 Tax=Sneathiella sp. HT1-7 TaxID=2887192 RepID=UPI001D15229B|nr:DUF2332 family protein [Sneathiella sp. HT1-7]MCC3305548.1 DUF2332 family protein [Sneathiella sp. HT1-7]